MGRYRKSQYGNLAKYNDTYVNKEGTYIEDGDGNQLTIQTDSDGYKFTDESYYLTYIDEAVIRGFKKKPDLSSCDGYVVSHIDGDVSNCCLDNLEWVKIDPSKQTKAGHVYFDDAIVGKNGTLVIMKNGTEETAQIRERWLDEDLDLVWIHKTPKVYTFETNRYGPEMHDIEEWMNQAGYIDGDQSKLNDPAILHKDYDVCNFKSENLEWCEKTDPRYVEYDKIREQRQKDMIKEYNPGRKLPDYWPQ